MSPKVLVTGASGHLGYNLAKLLIDRGYAVRAAVRNADDQARTAPVRALGPAEIVSLDIRDASRFAAAASGVDRLFHLAATYRYFTGSPDADAEMMRDSIEGATNAINAAAKAGVPKTVLTSSMVTLPMVPPGAPAVDESQWRTDLSVPYNRAKVEAERAAWRLADELGVSLVTILPGTIGGPGFHKPTTTTDFIEGMMLGTMRMGAPDTNLAYVDVRDVAEAHILAAEKSVSGRFIVTNDHAPSFREFTQLLHRIDPKFPEAKMLIPDFVMPLAPFLDWMNAKLLGAPRTLTAELVASIRGKVWALSNARAKKELSWHPRIPIEQSLAETVTAIRQVRADMAARKATAPAGS